MGNIKGTERKIKTFGGYEAKLIFSNEDSSVAFENEISKKQVCVDNGQVDVHEKNTLLKHLPTSLGMCLAENKKYTDFCDRLAERSSEFMKCLNDHGHITLRVEYYENGRINAYIDHKLVGTLRMNPDDLHDTLEEFREDNIRIGQRG